MLWWRMIKGVTYFCGKSNALLTHNNEELGWNFSQEELKAYFVFLGFGVLVSSGLWLVWARGSSFVLQPKWLLGMLHCPWSRAWGLGASCIAGKDFSPSILGKWTAGLLLTRLSKEMGNNITLLFFSSESSHTEFWVVSVQGELSQGHCRTFQPALGRISFWKFSPHSACRIGKPFICFIRQAELSLISFKKRYSSLINWRVIAWNSSLQ